MTTSQTIQAPRTSWLRDFPYWHEVVLALLLIGVLVWAGIVEPAFVAIDTQRELSTHLWEQALLAIPMTLIIITAGIDLSVGSTVALSAVVLGMTFKFGWVGLIGMQPENAQGLSIWISTVLAIITGTLAGAANGFFIAKLRVHPLIVTLATLAAFRGIAEGISLGNPVSGFPDPFIFLGQGSVMGQPIAGWLFLLLAIVAAVVLIKTPFGRYLYAIGHNETATRFSGVAVDRVKLLLYTLSGTAAAIAAVFTASRLNAKANLGDGMELNVITAVVLGGTSIFGGRGTIIGTVLGVLLVHETREFVQWHWQVSEYYDIVIGILLIGSVLLNRLLSARGRGR
jgi:rhamnose transport system permease protein